MSATSFVYGEVLSGTVDGVNKVFSSLYSIDKIESLRLGFVDYSAFSFSGNTVTLTDAPTSGTGAPVIDYFRSDIVVPTPPSVKTLGDVISSIYLRIGQDNTSYQFPMALVREYVIEAIQVNTNKRVNPVRNTGIYTFNKAKDSNVLGYSPTEINVGTVPQYVPGNGMGLLEFQSFFSYGSKTSSSLTSLSGLTHVYNVDTRVNFGYALPEGVKKPSEVTMDGAKLNYVDYREYTTRNKGNDYCVYNGFLFLPRTLDERIVSVSYVKNTSIPTNDSDLIDFEPEYLNVFKLYVMKEIYADREEDRYATTVVRYREALANYKSYISRQVDGINNVVKSSAFSGF